MCCGPDLCLAILAFFFPPIAVCAKRGCCSPDSLINIALCILGWLPGVIHAWYIIAAHPEEQVYDPQDPDVEDGRVTYYYVQQGPGGQGGRGGNGRQQRRAYGAVEQDRQRPLSEQHLTAVDHVQAGSSAAAQEDETLPPPPSYQDSVRGDHKVQLP